MKCVYVRLCTGFSCMVRPDHDLDLDLSLLDVGEAEITPEMARFVWKGYDAVLYRSGGIIFKLLEDDVLAKRYAQDIWDMFGK